MLRMQRAAAQERPVLLRRLLRQSDRHCAALAAEEPRWHVVLETCAEMLGTAELGQALLWCESRTLKVGAGARVLVVWASESGHTATLGQALADGAKAQCVRAERVRRE